MPYKDPEKRKAAFKKYYEKNKDKILEKNRQWAADNPDRAREINTRSHQKIRSMDVEIINHDDIEETLDNLFPKPEPEPEPEKKPEKKPKGKTYPMSDEEVAEMLKDLKQ